jgi:hypothetical protein
LRGGGAGRGSFRIDHCDRFSDLHHVAFIEELFGKEALERRRDLGIDLISCNFENGLIQCDRIAFVLQPFNNGSLGDAFAHFRHDQLYLCHIGSDELLMLTLKILISRQK